MTTQHPADDTLQEFAMGLAPEWASHVAGCPACQAKAGLYQHMFSLLPGQPVPAFSFDVSAAVLGRIARKHRRTRPAAVIAAISGLTAAAIAAVVIFRNDLVTLFSGGLPVITWLVVITMISVLFVQGFDLFRTYRKKMREILQHSQQATV